MNVFRFSIFLLSIGLLAGCETVEQSKRTDKMQQNYDSGMEVEKPETERQVSADNGTITVTSESKEAEHDNAKPELPRTLHQVQQRDDLTDPRMLEAAQKVGLLPDRQGVGVEQGTAPVKRDDLTDPRMLAAARAAGIEVPRQGEAPMPIEVSNETPQETTTNSALSSEAKMLVSSTKKKTGPEAQDKREPQVNASAASVSTVENSVSETKDKAAPAKARPKIYTKDKLNEARMIPYYEKQLQRENLDPVIRAYYERQLEEARASKSAM